MTQPTEQLNDDHEPKHAVDEPESNVETLEAEQVPDAAELQSQLSEATSRGDQYFEVLKLRTLEAAAGDLVQALDHMPADDPRYYDDAGFPSLDGMREVATELVAARPYLAKATGNVHQGVKDSPVESTPEQEWSRALAGVWK